MTSASRDPSRDISPSLCYDDRVVQGGESLYRIINARRDVRRHFLPDPVPDDVLLRVLTAAHAAPSVGLSQPWDFLVITDIDVRRRVRDAEVDRGVVGMGDLRWPEAAHPEVGL